MTKEHPNTDQLDTVTDKYLKQMLDSVLPGTPDSALVDQTPTPLSENPNIIIALNAQDAHDKRMANLATRTDSIMSLGMRYAAYVDENVFKNPRSVFVGPTHPWHYFWAEDFEKDRDGVMPLSEASRQQLETILYKGYLPADFRALSSLFVAGNDAALLAINRKPHIIQALRAKKPPVPPPPMLPEHLFDKFGMLMAPTVNRRDGTLWVGRFRLYAIDRRIVEAGVIENRRLANGDHHMSGNGAVRQDGAMSGRFEIDLDRMFTGTPK